MEMNILPNIQMRRALVAYLREKLTIPGGVQPGAIRSALDISGDPAGSAGIYADVSDSGAHDGRSDRELVDLQVSVSCYTHADEDASGEWLESLLCLVADAIPGFSPALSGWEVEKVFPFSVSEVSAFGSAYRACTMTFAIFVSKCN